MSVYLRVVTICGLCSAFAVGGVFITFTAQGAANLSDAASISQNNTFNGVQNKFPKGISIGQQGSGGVTYFNGTLANLTTDEAGDDNPITVGDNMRVDGEIWRGENSGPGDDMPVKINDDLKLYGSVEGLDISDVNGLQDELDSPSWNTRTGYVSVAPSACRAFNSDNKTFASSVYAYPEAGGDLYCSVQLPPGVTVTGFSVTMYDSIASAINGTLRRGSHGSANVMAEVTSTGTGGLQTKSDNSINHSSVDNINYNYTVQLDFGAGSPNLVFERAVITYTYTAPY